MTNFVFRKNTNDQFELTMEIRCEDKPKGYTDPYINVRVSLYNKHNNNDMTQYFDPQLFEKALNLYDKWNVMFFAESKVEY